MTDSTHVVATVTAVDSPSPDDDQFCDGLHDMGAPIQYLCSRCFPEPQRRGDLAEAEDDDYDENRRDDDGQMG